ncbi:efflux transporter periplasmic adaptor subunit [Paraburkholderia ginsengiterrae]|uniref:Efflux transporter periplasmic adaptor subunit n=1 Tax=Paraburkholderia ginsengiterrae TaxID=1462993 RepID=A0A1A9NAQ1_9BURK|nr:efflux RND transporter periplasmic adaptor subunit [Paraburkholderia ginsengiterrae]OAJ60459.1 efflux transporter periplasmic adaptor subunit [Paraburkholderia ginsengiterrae]OAJ64012.1 efflux transporter periplasmic adaptor subunit [Paraburkholderia ginsengiterrae]
MEGQRPDGSHSARDAAQGHRARWIGVAVAVAVVALAAQGIWSRHDAHAELERAAEHASQTSVEVVRPQKSTSGPDLMLPGNVQAFLDTPIYARTNGYLKKWYADIGAHVKGGQLLAEIDTPEVDDQLRAARADLANADANYALAKSTADRWTDMLKSKSVSKQETDEKVGDMLAKKATLDAARFNVARLEKTQSFQKVYAPFDGIVTARNVDVGALIDAGSAGGPAKELFHVAQADRLRVYVNVPQAYALQIRAEQSAFLTLTETPSRHYPGVVARTAGAVDPQQRTMLVEVDVDNRNGDLLPGAYAQVHFALSTGVAPFTLPGNTLLFRPDGVKVATVDAQHKVKLMPVSLGTDFGTRVAIVSGLRGDEQVIVNPQDSIVDGAQVRIVAAKVEGASGLSGAPAVEGAASATGAFATDLPTVEASS